jgi:hypothetical protein
MISTTSRSPLNRRLILSAIFLLILFIFLIIFFSFNSLNRQPIIKEVRVAAALDDQFRPIGVTDVYAPENDFFVSVEVTNYDGTDPLIARWLYEGKEITQTRLASQLAGTLHVGFTLHNENPPWPTGRYRVDILYNDKILESATFEVQP